ncbi:MAG: DUF929 family protein, partial [Isosphaeraceae bacterium]
MSTADELSKLDSLRQTGVLTQEEFDGEKAKLLRGGLSSAASSSPQPSGAEAPQGEGWWQASDGQWYAPATHPRVPPPPGSYSIVTTPHSTNGLAIASFVLSILWIVGLGSILAVVFALKARSSIRRSKGVEGGDGLAIAGLVIGCLGILGAVLLVIAVAVISASKTSASNSSVPNTPANAKPFGMKTAPASVVNAISNVSASDFAVAGTSITSSGPWTQFLSAPKNPQPLTSGGKPLIVYVGSNYCPYCAATRWPLAVALARFGTFKGLKITASGLADEYPGTPTLSYYHVSYKSPYIAFLSSEQCSDVVSTTSSPAVQDCFGYEPLEKLTGTALKVFSKYDAQPYQSANNAGGIPFVDFGNQLIEDGAFMDPTILAGYTPAEIAQSLSENPAASPAQTIL